MNRRPPAPTLRDGLVRRRVVVTLSDDSGIRGLLYSIDPTGALVGPAAGEQVEYLPPDGNDWVPAQGSLFAMTPQIKFIQLPEGT